MASGFRNGGLGSRRDLQGRQRPIGWFEGGFKAVQCPEEKTTAAFRSFAVAS